MGLAVRLNAAVSLSDLTFDGAELTRFKGCTVSHWTIFYSRGFRCEKGTQGIENLRFTLHHPLPDVSVDRSQLSDRSPGRIDDMGLFSNLVPVTCNRSHVLHRQ